MKKSHTVQAKNNTHFNGILVGSISAMMITLLLSIGLTSVILNGSLALQAAEIVLFIIRVLSVFSGCLIACFLAKKNILQAIGFSSLGYLLILIAIAIVVFDGSFQHFTSGLLSVLVGAIIAFVVKMLKPGSGKRTKKHYR